MMSNKKLLICIIIGLLLLLGCSKKKETIYNQCGIDGIVTDWSLSPYPSAVLVTIENTSDNTQTHTAVSDADGKFSFRNIKAGNYKISIQKDGYVMWGISIDGTHYNTDLIELKNNQIKSIEIKIRNNNQLYEHLDLTDIYGNAINGSIYIPKYSPTVTFKLYNGTSRRLSYLVGDVESCLIGCTYMPYTWGYMYIFKSFSPTSGALEPGEEAVLIGEVDADFYDFCSNDSPYDYLHTLYFSLGGVTNYYVDLNFDLGK